MASETHVESEAVTRTADVLMTIVDIHGITAVIYRCNECKAMTSGPEDTRDHLHWHDRLLHVQN